VQVMSCIINEALPLLYMNAMSGHVEFSTTNCVFERNPNAVDMFIDVLTDRGFKVSHGSRDIGGDPVRVDTQTGVVHRTNTVPVHVFRISFGGGNVRESLASAGNAPFGEPRCGFFMWLHTPSSDSVLVAAGIALIALIINFHEMYGIFNNTCSWSCCCDASQRNRTAKNDFCPVQIRFG
jgi:hypothetical protein